MENKPYLEEYYGLECPHCQKMQALGRKAEAETGIAFARFEVWHNKENMARIEEIDKEAKCGGVPFYRNTQTGKTLCGEVDYETMLKWAKGEEFSQ
ncbi:MAG: hypothetical protein WCO58_02875 [bacterium]